MMKTSADRSIQGVMVDPVANAEPILSAQHLSLNIQAGNECLHVLDDIQCSIKPGETLALVGESGCGKSLTASALLRLLPSNAEVIAGSVRLGNNDLLQLPEEAMRHYRGRRLGMIFQEPGATLNPVFTVAQLFDEVFRCHAPLPGQGDGQWPVSNDAIRTRSLSWLRRLGFQDAERILSAYPFTLSGGQKQRVAIALALAAEPDILIADEPTTALDVLVQAQVLALLKDLQRDLGMALILITHDLGIVRHMANRVALMYAGQIVELANVDDFFDEALKDARHPYANALLAALPGAERSGQRLAEIPGQVPSMALAFQGCRFAPRCFLRSQLHSEDARRCDQIVPALIGDDHHGVRCHFADRAGRHLLNTPNSNFLPLPSRSQEAPSGEKICLRVSNMSVGYDAGRWWQRSAPEWTVAGVSFTIAAGRTLAVVGGSGSGKTTIAKALLGLLHGRARLAGELECSVKAGGHERLRLSLESKRDLNFRRSVQMVFQDPFASLNPRHRVSDILEEGMRELMPGTSQPWRSREIRRMLDHVGLPTTALQRFPHEFSGGQRQRIAIARALVVQPSVLILDEPTSALDVSVQAQILNLLQDLRAEHALAYLFISHHFSVVEYMADELLVLEKGRVVEQGQAKQLIQHPQHAYTRSLLEAVI